jgi:hypothetical protein
LVQARAGWHVQVAPQPALPWHCSPVAQSAEDRQVRAPSPRGWAAAPCPGEVATAEPPCPGGVVTAVAPCPGVAGTTTPWAVAGGGGGGGGGMVAGAVLMTHPEARSEHTISVRKRFMPLA